MFSCVPDRREELLFHAHAQEDGGIISEEKFVTYVLEERETKGEHSSTHCGTAQLQAQIKHVVAQMDSAKQTWQQTVREESVDLIGKPHSTARRPFEPTSLRDITKKMFVVKSRLRQGPCLPALKSHQLRV